MVGTGNFLNIVVRQFPRATVDQMSKITRIDEQDFIFTRMVVVACAVHKPQRRRNLGIQKQFGGQVDDAVDQVALGDQAFADVAFAGGFRGQRTFGQYHTGDAAGRQVVDEMLQPGEIGVARRRRAVLPACVAAQLLAAPVADVERRIGDDEIGFEVLVRVVQERAFVVPFDLRAVDAADGEVHFRQPPGGLVAFLSVNGNVADAALMFFDEFFRLHEHAAGAAARIEYPALVWFEHVHQQFDDAARSVELTALFAFRQCEFAEKIFEHMAEHVAAAGFGVTERNIADQVDQFTQ